MGVGLRVEFTTSTVRSLLLAVLVVFCGLSSWGCATLPGQGVHHRSIRPAALEQARLEPLPGLQAPLADRQAAYARNRGLLRGRELRLGLWHYQDGAAHQELQWLGSEPAELDALARQSRYEETVRWAGPLWVFGGMVYFLSTRHNVSPYYEIGATLGVIGFSSLGKKVLDAQRQILERHNRRLAQRLGLELSAEELSVDWTLAKNPGDWMTINPQEVGLFRNPYLGQKEAGWSAVDQAVQASQGAMQAQRLRELRSREAWTGPTAAVMGSVAIALPFGLISPSPPPESLVTGVLITSSALALGAIVLKWVEVAAQKQQTRILREHNRIVAPKAVENSAPGSDKSRL